jgi:hypothetical protein
MHKKIECKFKIGDIVKLKYVANTNYYVSSRLIEKFNNKNLIVTGTAHIFGGLWNLRISGNEKTIPQNYFKKIGSIYDV